MCPLCVIGSVFFIQLMGFIRWFHRVILRKPVEGDGEYWVPERIPYKEKIQLALKDRRKCMIVGSVIAAEIVLAIIVWQVGGFKIIKVVWAALQ